MGSSNYKVLLLEDNPVELDIIRRVFAKIPTEYIVESVETLEEALKRLEQGGIDIILTDLGVPDSVGAATFIQINVKFPNLPIVVLTNLLDLEMAGKLIEIGAQDYIHKMELTANTLETTIRNSLARKQSKHSSSISAEAIVQQPFANYTYHMRLLNERSLYYRQPDVFNFFTEFYTSLLLLPQASILQNIQTKLRAVLKQQHDAFLMVNLAPSDLLDIHNHSLQSPAFVDIENEEFRKHSSIVLQESISYLYYAYSE